MSFLIRAPRPGEEEAALAVYVARDLVDLGAPDCTLEDVRVEWTAPACDAWVGEEDGEIVAVAVLDENGGAYAVHPEAEGREMGPALIETIESRARKRGMDVSRIYTGSGNRVAHQEVAAAGYRRAHSYVKLRAERDELPEHAPAGHGLRPVRFGEEDRELHAVISEAFKQIPGNTDWSFEAFQAEVLGRDTLAREWAFAAEDEEGLSGVVLCERRDRAGYISDLAVHPRAQRRGLGRALVEAALAGIRADGLPAELWAHGDNARALALYASVGLREVARGERWERSL